MSDEEFDDTISFEPAASPSALWKWLGPLRQIAPGAFPSRFALVVDESVPGGEWRLNGAGVDMGAAEDLLTLSFIRFSLRNGTEERWSLEHYTLKDAAETIVGQYNEVHYDNEIDLGPWPGK